MEDNKNLYKIAVNSKVEFRKIKFLLKSIGHNVDGLGEYYNSCRALYIGSKGEWKPTNTSLAWLDSLGYKDLTLQHLIDDVIKALPKPKKEKAFPAEEVMKQMKTGVSDSEPYAYPFKECAVRVKNKAQLLEVLAFVGLKEEDIEEVSNEIEYHTTYDDLCVNISSRNVSVNYGARKEDTLSLGTQDFFRKKQYYIMEYNNFRRKS